MSTEEPKSQASEGPVHTALEHVQKAEHDLERARELERKAEDELRRAEEELREAEKHRCETVEVHVTHVNDVETAKFEASLHATLQAVWDKSYLELEVAKHPKDIFQTAGDKPSSLMSHLALTLAQAKEQHVITNFRFEIVSETGGA
jgi:hypothetical protein